MESPKAFRTQQNEKTKGGFSGTMENRGHGCGTLNFQEILPVCPVDSHACWGQMSLCYRMLEP